MDCKACTAAMTSPRIDRWANGCPSCQARALAVIGSHIDETPGQPISKKFRRVVQELFGENWKAGAQQVKEWASVIRRHEASQRAAKPSTEKIE